MPSCKQTWSISSTASTSPHSVTLPSVWWGSSASWCCLPSWLPITGCPPCLDVVPLSEHSQSPGSITASPQALIWLYSSLYTPEIQLRGLSSIDNKPRRIKGPSQHRIVSHRLATTVVLIIPPRETSHHKSNTTVRHPALASLSLLCKCVTSHKLTLLGQNCLGFAWLTLRVFINL